MKTSIGVGVIGTGFARKTQIPGFAAVANAQVVSVASGSLENAAAAAEAFSIGHFTDDWRETVNREDVDLVCVTTPPNLHYEMTLDALANGKHVLCEKPMAMNAFEASEMLRLASESGKLAVIDHQMRFTNGRLAAFEMIREGRIGSVRHARYLFRNSVRGDSSLPWTWWSDSRQGGGALGAIGSHVIDSFRWFLDAEIEDVYCRLHTHVKERPDGDSFTAVTSDDEVLMTLKFCEGPLMEDATASVSASMVEAGPYRNRIEFFGTKGALRIEDGGEIFLADLADPVWARQEVELGSVAEGMREGGWSRGFTVIAERIVETIQADKTTFDHAPTFADGLAIQKVLDAARESDMRKLVVRIN